MRGRIDAEWLWAGRVLLFTLAILSVPVGSGLCVRAQEDDERAMKERLRTEWPAAVARLEARYSRVTMKGTLTEVRRSGGPGGEAPGGGHGAGRPQGAIESTSSRQLVLHASDGLKKYEQGLIIAQVYDPNTRTLRPVVPVAATRSVGCLGRHDWFRLAWNDETPTVTDFGPLTDLSGRLSLTSWHRDFLEALAGPVGVIGASRLLSFPSFAVVKVTRPADQRDHLLIEFVFDIGDDKERVVPDKVVKALAAVGKKPAMRGIWKGWIEVAPDEDWAVHGYGSNHPTTGMKGRVHQIDYGEPRDGVPIPRRITVSNPMGTMIQTFEIERVEFGPIPEREFTLSAYGLPERDVTPARTR